MTSFKNMTEKEKKNFLSMDLVERIIRLEQRVSASFGEFIPYTKTHYFKSLSKNEKIKFIEYLKKYKRRKYVLGFLFSLFVVVSFIFKGNITGKVVSENVFSGESIYGTIFLIFLLFVVFLLIILLFFKNKREKRIKGHFKVIDKIYLRKIRK